MQTITPPTSKSPWVAATTGGTYKNRALEDWGPAIMSGVGMLGPYGRILATLGGAAGMGGRGTGFQGTDYGWGNIMPTVMGAFGGATSTPWGGAMSTLSKTAERNRWMEKMFGKPGEPETSEPDMETMMNYYNTPYMSSEVPYLNQFGG